jgi:hypothetical protein
MFYVTVSSPLIYAMRCLNGQSVRRARAGVGDHGTCQKCGRKERRRSALPNAGDREQGRGCAAKCVRRAKAKRTRRSSYFCKHLGVGGTRRGPGPVPPSEAWRLRAGKEEGIARSSWRQGDVARAGGSESTQRRAGTIRRRGRRGPRSGVRGPRRRPRGTPRGAHRPRTRPAKNRTDSKRALPIPSCPDAAGKLTDLLPKLQGTRLRRSTLWHCLAH